jgi:hypothetical protein
MHGRDGEYTISVRKPTERRIFGTQDVKKYSVKT